MTKGERELEFERLKPQWWWQDSETVEDAQISGAYAWELLRRTRCFCRFHCDAMAIPLPESPRAPSKGIPLSKAAGMVFGSLAEYRQRVQALAHHQLPLDAKDPKRTWGELFLAGCNPTLSWRDLPAEAKQAILNSSSIIPRQEKPSKQYRISVCRVIACQNSTGSENLFAVELHHGKPQLIPQGKTLNPAILSKHSAVPILPIGVERSGYVVIQFDERAGEAAFNQLEEWLSANNPESKDARADSWWQAPADSLATLSGTTPLRSRSKKRHRIVVPSKEQHMVQTWIKVDPLTTLGEIKSAFRTLLTPRQRKQWLPKCRAQWGKPERIRLFGQIRDVRFPAESKLPVALKTKSGQLNIETLRMGLMALDCRRLEPKFLKTGRLMSFLSNHKPAADCHLLTEAMKMVKRRIADIDATYPSS